MEDKERYRTAVRTGLAKALAASAQGLSAASRALASTARQLRPPEAAEEASAEEADEAASTATASGGAPTGTGTDGPGVGAVGSEFDAAELAASPVREVLPRIPGLTPDQLDTLAEAERGGKGRKTVLDAIERARQL